MAKVIIVLEDEGNIGCSIHSEVLEQPDGEFSFAVSLAEKFTPFMLETRDGIVEAAVDSIAQEFVRSLGEKVKVNTVN